MESNFKNDINELIYKRETDSDFKNKLTVTKGERLYGGIKLKLGINTYTVLYIKQTTNKDLLYSTGNSTQYSITNYV